MPRTDATIPGITIEGNNASGEVTNCQGAGLPTSIATLTRKFARGCVYVDSNTGSVYINQGTVLLPSWAGWTPSATGGAYTTVGYADADYIVDGVADDVQIQTALAAVNAAGGGTVLCLIGVFNCYAAVDLKNMINVCLIGASREATILKGAGTITGTAYKSGVVNLKDSTVNVANVTISNLTVDANNISHLCGIVIATSLTLTTITNLRIKGIITKNSDTTTPSIMFAAGACTTFSGPRGAIDGLHLEDIETADNDLYAMVFDGSQMTNVIFNQMYIHDTGFSGVYLATDVKESNKNWKLLNSRFERNKQGTLTNPQADFHDANLNGIINFEVRGNYFGPCTIPSNKLNDFNLTVYNMRGCIIDSNFFEGPGTDGGAAMAIGASKSGTYYKTDANQMISITNNTFYKVRAPFDGDSNYFANISGNYFWYTEYRPISNYSRHFPTTISNNFIYNCVTNPPNANDYENCGIYTHAGIGMNVHNNYIIDDRELRDPTTAATLTDIAGGSLGATTYYVKYTWSNATGETLASAESSRAVAANRRLVATLPISIPNGAPTGATLCNFYVSTSSGTETLQASVAIPNKDNYSWTEPTTGLVTGAALPGSNTTHALMKYGIYELDNSTDAPVGNLYHSNSISGMSVAPIYLYDDSSVVTNNIGVNPERIYVQGNISGATTFSRLNGETIKATITGNVTTTVNNGLVKGDTLTLQITQSGGGNTISKPANVKLVGGAFSPSAGAGAIDTWTLVWDGTSWNETSRALNLS